MKKMAHICHILNTQQQVNGYELESTTPHIIGNKSLKAQSIKDNTTFRDF
jgi:hypothetical protein